MNVMPMVQIAVLLFFPFKSVSAWVSDKNASISELRQRAREGYRGAILELGERDDKGSAEILRERINSSDAIELRLLKELQAELMNKGMFDVEVLGNREAVFAAKMALVKMGEDKDSKFFNEFVVGISSANQVFEIDCIRALGYIGERRAVKYLAPVLWQKGGVGTYDSSYGIFADEAIKAILKIIPPPVKLDPLRNYQDEINDWQKWWLKNGDKYK